MFATLRHRNFALLWSAGLVSLAGDAALKTALPFYVYAQTGSTVASAGMVLASVLPGVLLGPVAGVFVDRWNRQWIMIAVNSVQALLLLLLVVLLWTLEHVWVVYVVTFAQAMLGQFFSPAENAVLPTLVDGDHLAPANALNALNDNLARMVGPALGGTVFATLGLPSVVVVNVVAFVVAAGLIACIRTTPGAPLQQVGARVYAAPTRAHVDAVPPPQSAVWHELLDGLRYIWRNQQLRLIVGTAGATALGIGINQPLQVAFVNDIVRGGAQTFGWLVTVQGVGGIGGALFIGSISTHVAPHRLFGLSLLGLGGAFLMGINFPVLPIVVLMFFIIGPTWAGYMASQQTLLQLQTTDALRGRIFATLGTVSALCGVVGTSIGGVLGDRLGVVPILNVAGGVWVVSGLLAALFFRRSVASERDRERDRGPEPVAPVSS